MNFNSKVAKLCKGKCVNGYENKAGEICLFLNNNGLVKKHLIDKDGAFLLEPKEYNGGATELIKLADNLYVERVQSKIKVQTSEE